MVDCKFRTLRRENTLDPLSCQNDTFTCDRLSYTSDGRDYTDLVKEKINLPAEPKVEGKPTRFDPEKGQEYKAKAMEELTAQGVTFPIELDWFVKGGNQQALDMASVLQTVFKNSLGDDFITVKINQYVSSINQEVLYLCNVCSWIFNASFFNPTLNTNLILSKMLYTVLLLINIV